MLGGEGQAQHWRRIAGWEHPDTFRKANLQLEGSRELAQNLHQAIPKAFPRSTDWSKIHTCSQRPDESVHDYYNRFQVFLKENSGLPSDIDTTHVT